jgi:hypothetical protein
MTGCSVNDLVKHFPRLLARQAAALLEIVLDVDLFLGQVGLVLFVHVYERCIV